MSHVCKDMFYLRPIRLANAARANDRLQAPAHLPRFVSINGFRPLHILLIRLKKCGIYEACQCRLYVARCLPRFQYSLSTDHKPNSMSSLSTLPYSERATRHPHPVARLFLETAEAKKSNLIVSTDLTTSAELLKCADGKT